MLLKSADDKSRRVALLEELQRSTQVDYAQKKWLREEVSRLKKGIQGERDSAHYIDSYFKGGVNNVVMHDLRFVVDGDVAQIDHMIVNRLGHVFLLETKNYAGSLHINAHGEFTAIYGDDRFGIPSPIEQSLRHERILLRLLERLDIVGRTQKQPDVHHIVMLHPQAVIERPKPSEFDTGNVIKADQFPTWHQKFGDSRGTGAVFKALLNMRSLDTIKEWCEKLLRQHRPADLLVLPEFMRPKDVAMPTQAATSPPALAPVVRPVKPKVAIATAVPASVTTPASSGGNGESAKRLICAHCQSKISFPEGKFCWNNVKRFGGLQYCREHQALFQ